MALKATSTSFGQPNGNPRANPSVAVAQREFYRWVETQATEEEIKAYMKDTTKPFARRKFVELYFKSKRVEEVLAVTNQTHGMPKQTIGINEAPEISINFGKNE